MKGSLSIHAADKPSEEDDSCDMTMPLLRYPGGKAKLQTVIVHSLLEACQGARRQYREPFFGGGAVGLALLGHPQVAVFWLKDKDPGIAALWTAVVRYPDRLVDRIAAFEPTVDAFDAFKAELLTVTALPPVSNALADLGFKKLALHQMSYSGLGVMSGGPLGGRAQSSQSNIDSRWSPDRLVRQVWEFHRRFAAAGVHESACTNLDFCVLIEDESRPAVLYLDPPYVEQGNSLYRHGVTQADHIRLAEALRKTPHPWVLSYDDCPLVRDLYSWANLAAVGVGYSVASARRTAELLITLARQASSVAVSEQFSLAS